MSPMTNPPTTNPTRPDRDMPESTDVRHITADGLGALTDLADLTDLFTATGVPASYTRHVAAHLGAHAAESLRGDPWRLLLAPGIRPDQADRFARALLGAEARPGDPRRARALVTHLLSTAARDGHTATPGPRLVSALAGLKVPDPVAAVNDALDEALIMAFVDEPPDDDVDPSAGDLDEVPEPDPVVGLTRPALAEEALAEGVIRMLATAAALPVEPGDGSLAPAIATAATAGVSVLRLPAGADPAEVVCALAAAVAAAGVKVGVACATRRSAARLAGCAGPASGSRFISLYRLLEAEPAAGGIVFGRGERAPLDADLLVVPDAQALDVELAAALVEACADGAHLVLAGNPDEPSSGPGRVLADLADSGVVPVVDPPMPPGGPISRLAAAVAGGTLPAVDAPDREVVIVPAGGAPEAVHRALQLVGDSIPRAFGIDPDQIQVLTTTAGGPGGVHALNAALKRRFNPGPAGTTRPGTTQADMGPAPAPADVAPRLDPGDRVIVTSPFGDLTVGETGVVDSVDGDALVVRFSGEPVIVPGLFRPRLRHAWAITIEEAGCERWPAVVVVLPPGAALSRPLVASAFGRATRHLSVVQAAGPALAQAVAVTTARERRTRLTGLLRQ